VTADISRRALVRTLAAAGVASAVGIPRAAHAIVPGGGRRSGAGELLIRGGRVVNADGVVTADVRIVGEQITEVGRNLTPGAGARVIEANGMLLMPGGSRDGV